MTHFFRRMPRSVQRAWALYPGAEWLALRLPDGMEWAWMQRCHGNWLQWWSRQRRRWHFYHHLSFSISFSSPVSLLFPSIWQIVHYFVLLFLLLRNLTHGLSRRPSLLSQSCWVSSRVPTILNTFVCLVQVFVIRTYLKFFTNRVWEHKLCLPVHN